MTAYAEGYEMLAAEDLIKDPQAVYQAWTNGTVVRSWLQQLLAKALKEDPRARRDHAATPKTPARAGGRSRRRSGCACRCPASRRRCSRGSCPGRTIRRR